MSDDPRIIEIDELIEKGTMVLKGRTREEIQSRRINPIIFFQWVADVAQFLVDNFDQRNVYYAIFFTRVNQEKNPV